MHCMRFALIIVGLMVALSSCQSSALSQQPVILSVDCTSIQKGQTGAGMRNLALADIGDIIELEKSDKVGRRVASIDPFNDQYTGYKYSHMQFIRNTNLFDNQQVNLTSTVKIVLTTSITFSDALKSQLTADLERQLTANTSFIVKKFYKTYFKNPIEPLNADDALRETLGPQIAARRNTAFYVIIGDVIYAGGVEIKVDDSSVRSAAAQYGRIANLNIAFTNSCSGNVAGVSVTGAPFFVKPYPIDFDMRTKKFFAPQNVTADDINFDNYSIVRTNDGDKRSPTLTDLRNEPTS